MPRYVAFLRGLNVGGHRVKMDRLCSLFEELGFSNVSSFIASGNIIFDGPGSKAADLEDRIAVHLRSALGYDVATFLRTIPGLREVIERQPFPDDELAVPGHSVHVTFLHHPLSGDAVDLLIGLRTERDEFAASGREFFWLSRGRLSDSPVSMSMMAKAIGAVEGTMRNLNTLQRIVTKFGADA